MQTPFDPQAFALSVNRRAFLKQSAYGLGGIALASLLDPRLLGSAQAADSRWRGVIGTPHFPIKAKRVIHLCMAGGPSHLETFDWKPELKKLDGQPFPESFTKGQQLAQLLRWIMRFALIGKCGVPMTPCHRESAACADPSNCGSSSEASAMPPRP